MRHVALKESVTSESIDFTHFDRHTRAGTCFAATGEYFSDCRCGGQYAVTEDELRSGCDTVVCNQCSLSVRVLFSVDDGDGNTDGHGDGQ